MRDERWQQPCPLESRGCCRLMHRNSSSKSLLHKHHITHIASQSVLSSVKRFSGGLVVLEELCGKKCEFFTKSQLPGQGCLRLAALADLEPQARFRRSCLGREHLQV